MNPDYLKQMINIDLDDMLNNSPLPAHVAKKKKEKKRVKKEKPLTLKERVALMKEKLAEKG